MAEQKKKRKRLKILIVLVVMVVIICLAGFGSLQLMDHLGQQAMKKMEEQLREQAESGELQLPEGFVFQQEVLEQLPNPEEQQFLEQPEQQDEQPVEEQPTVQQGNGGGVGSGGGVDLSYASAIASVASSADIAAAYSAVLGCLSAADKAQVAAYLANGQDSEAYSLVYSKITGDAYQTLVGLYYKYLPMVQ